MKSQSILPAICGLVLAASGADNFWTLDSAEQANWTSDNYWSLGEKPSEANPAKIPQNAGTEAAWKNANILVNTFETPGAFVLGNKDYTSNRLEIVTGGVISSTSFSACTFNSTYGEIVFNGGVMTNSTTDAYYIGQKPSLGCCLKAVMNSGEWYVGPMHFGRACPTVFEINGGRIVSRCASGGLYLAEDQSSIGARGDFKMTGGEIDVSTLRFKGSARMTGGLIAATGDVQFSGGTTTFRGANATIESGGNFTVGGEGRLEDMTVTAASMTFGSIGTVNGVLTVNTHTQVVESGTLNVKGALQPNGKYSGSLAICGDTLLIKDGTLTLDSGSTLDPQSYVNGSQMSTSTLHVAGGTVSLHGTRLNVPSSAPGRLGPCVIRQTGGTLTENAQIAWNATARPDIFHLIELSGGTASIGGIYPNSASTPTNGLVFRVIGGKPQIKLGYIEKADDERILPPFFDGVVADGELSTVKNSNSYHPYYFAMCALRPQGGLQMTTNSVFFQLARSTAQSSSDYLQCVSRCRWREGLFTTNGTRTAIAPSSGVVAEWAFDPSAAVASTMTAADGGFASAAGVPWGWYDLPPVRTNALKRALVDLTLEPMAKTFAQLKTDLEDAGYAVKSVDAATGRVSIELPLNRLGDKATDRRLFFDFTEYRTPRDIYEGRRTTNAVVKAISYTQEKLGLMLLLK